MRKKTAKKKTIPRKKTTPTKKRQAKKRPSKVTPVFVNIDASNQRESVEAVEKALLNVMDKVAEHEFGDHTALTAVTAVKMAVKGPSEITVNNCNFKFNQK